MVTPQLECKPQTEVVSPDAVAGRSVRGAAMAVVVHRALSSGDSTAGDLGLPSEAVDAFLQAWEFLRQRTPEIQGEVWQDPRCYLWSRTAFELLAQLRRKENKLSEREALQNQLRDALRTFSELAVSAALRSETSFSCLPISREAGLWSPLGSDRIFDLNTSGEILGVEQGVLRHSAEHLSEERKIPRVLCGSHSFQLHPGIAADLAPLGIYFGAAPEEQRFLLDYQSEVAEHLAEALAVVERSAPEQYARVCESIGYILLKPADHGGFANLSHSDLPGFMYISNQACVYDLADTIVHEYRHHELFAIEEEDRVFNDNGIDPYNEAKFYSPLRDDPRPMHGLFHAYFVMLPVLRLWKNLSERDAGHESDPRKRAYYYALQLKILASQILSVGKTTFGMSLFSSCEEERAVLERELSFSDTVLLQACAKEIIEHIEGHAPGDLREVLRAELNGIL